MGDNRHVEWIDDNMLKSVLVKYVQQGLKRCEILDFVTRDFPEYTWSIRSLDRRLLHFEIFYKDDNVEVAEVMEVVGSELKGW